MLPARGLALARHFHRSPDGLGPANIRDYQLYLANEKKLAPGSILIATSALRFLYTVTMKRPWDVEEVLPMPKKPEKLPVILSPEDVRHFLSCVLRRKARTVLTVCYAARLRVPSRRTCSSTVQTCARSRASVAVNHGALPASGGLQGLRDPQPTAIRGPTSESLLFASVSAREAYASTEPSS